MVAQKLKISVKETRNTTKMLTLNTQLVQFGRERVIKAFAGEENIEFCNCFEVKTYIQLRLRGILAYGANGIFAI
jgi:hypothetical protein